MLSFAVEARCLRQCHSVPRSLTHSPFPNSCELTVIVRPQPREEMDILDTVEPDFHMERPLIENLVTSPTLGRKKPGASLLGGQPGTLLRCAQRDIALDAPGQPADEPLRERARGELHQLQVLDAGETDLEVAEQRI